MAITLYRFERGVSPTLNFGRMPAGYRRSSANNARLVTAGKRFRGGPCTTSDATHLPGIRPLAQIDDDPGDLRWGDLDWSAWTAVTPAAVPAPAVGLYRLRHIDQERLVYIGEGKIQGRITPTSANR